MKKLLSTLLLVALCVTILTPLLQSPEQSSPLSPAEISATVGGSLFGCVTAGLWGAGIILSAGLGGPVGAAAATYVMAPIALAALSSCMS